MQSDIFISGIFSISILNVMTELIVRVKDLVYTYIPQNDQKIKCIVIFYLKYHYCDVKLATDLLILMFD